MSAHFREIGIPKFNWKLPVCLTQKDIVSITLSPAEVKSIADYVEDYFDKAGTDKQKSQWNHSKGLHKVNPNEIGIRGEWAGLRYFEKKPSLLDFLVNRPWRMGDFGDIILKGNEYRIFDYKTRSRSETPASLVSSDQHLAEMDAKFVREQYQYLQGFIFCTDDPENSQVHLVGWLPAKVFFENAMYVKAGDNLPYQHYSYHNDCVVFPYRRLRPMSELKLCKMYPISEGLTKQFKRDWKIGDELQIEQYLAYNL